MLAPYSRCPLIALFPVGTAVAVADGVGDEVAVAAAVRLAVADAVRLAVGVLVTVAVAVRDAVGVAVGSSVGVGDGPLATNSYAPQSICAPCGRETPSRSVGRSGTAVPASRAGLVALR